MSNNYIETLAENATHRVMLAPDESPSEPDNDGSTPLIRLDYGLDGWHAEQVTSITSYVVPSEIVTAVQRCWVSHDLFDRYLRVWHGTTDVIWWHSGDFWYVTFDTADWREAMGLPLDAVVPVSMDEWQAYCEGDVYGLVLEAKHTWTSDDGRTETRWEVEDSVWGFYGEQYPRDNWADHFPLDGA